MVKRRFVLGALALAVLAGCAPTPPNPTLLLRYENSMEGARLSDLIGRAGPGPVAVVDLGRTAWVSHHLAVVRDAEKPHYHRFHDLTVIVMRGEGIIDIDGKRYPLRAGDVVQVNRGMRHYFRNTGKEPSAAFVVFSPPFDGRDTVAAEAPAEESAKQAPPPERPWWRFWRRQ